MECRSGAWRGLMGFTALCMVSGMVQAGAVSRDWLEEAGNSYICVFRPDIAPSAVSQKSSSIARQHGETLRFVYHNALKGFSARASAQGVAKMAAHPDIDYCERNGVVSLTVVDGGSKSMALSGARSTVPQQIPYGVTRVGGPFAGAGKHAWVIDTGIDGSNRDLHVGPGANFVRGKNTTDDGHGHGTHVAGTIAAVDNTIDVVGVAAGAMVHPVRVLDNRGNGTVDGVIAGIDYVAANAQSGDVANMSLGAFGHFQSLHDAVVNAADRGIFFAVSAGNDAAYAGNYEPAHVEHPNVYTVSAVDRYDRFAVFSNYGNPPVDFAAPGVNVVSNRVGGGVVAYSGTSMAAPHVAGLLLLLGGTPNLGGSAWGDPDGVPDPIAHY